MGYTHYWSFDFSCIPRGQTALYERWYRQAILQCQQFAYDYNRCLPKGHADRLSGFSTHVEPGTYQGLNINGRRENQHELFCMREHLKHNEQHNFCKTARKPYDRVVVACLRILQAFLGPAISVSSDGTKDDWRDGLKLSRRYASTRMPKRILK